eukprot:CAMPEP_0115091112 /NCGR_PEP_ID=MMETSP0227-20121206/25889_1 /TAXON_ID=89957 /ORGANISM="Polarella glacialis, Strain CCMP 1383" /LENGTH=87 /DNA_ID=CAMNT_0002482503 /DNA_START=108 /DNA_END=371 /DNA_ORIENTATION=+
MTTTTASTATTTPSTMTSTSAAKSTTTAPSSTTAMPTPSSTSTMSPPSAMCPKCLYSAKYEVSHSSSIFLLEAWFGALVMLPLSRQF